MIIAGLTTCLAGACAAIAVSVASSGRPTSHYGTLFDAVTFAAMMVGQLGMIVTLGSRTFRPNSRGKIYMIMESYLYEENPEVQIPNDAKMNVLPASPEEIEDIRSR